MNTSAPNDGSVFGAYISVYTRAQAIADGVLIDVSEMSREAGFRFPVAMTRAAWEDCVMWSDEDSRLQVHQDEAGRRWARRHWTLPKYTKYCMFLNMFDLKPIQFRGSALDDLRAFPISARREAGHQLDQLQHGRDPDDWKPMNGVGQGVREIRIRDASGAFRVLYVAKFEDAVYVLHCFQKKTEKTSKADIDLAAKRYRDLLGELKR